MRWNVNAVGKNAAPMRPPHSFTWRFRWKMPCTDSWRREKMVLFTNEKAIMAITTCHQVDAWDARWSSHPDTQVVTVSRHTLREPGMAGDRVAAFMGCYCFLSVAGRRANRPTSRPMTSPATPAMAVALYIQR